MPPYFVYVMALMVYIAIACAVWFVAVVLAFPRRTREFARRIAAGMAGSFPGVFLFQFIAAPLAGLFLLLFGGIFWAFRPAGGAARRGPINLHTEDRRPAGLPRRAAGRVARRRH